jgi:choline dehydrogenase-like flavoprotein
MPLTVYDLVVAGSGARGGTLAARLAQQGAKVTVVEGGPKVNTRTDFNTHALPYEFASRHIPIMKPGKPGFDSERTRPRRQDHALERRVLAIERARFQGPHPRRRR